MPHMTFNALPWCTFRNCLVCMDIEKKYKRRHREAIICDIPDGCIDTLYLQAVRLQAQCPDCDVKVILEPCPKEIRDEPIKYPQPVDNWELSRKYAAVYKDWQYDVAQGNTLLGFKGYFETRPESVPAPEPQFLNKYQCTDCETYWEVEWSCTCNDRCPGCNAEIEPFDSKEV